MAVQKFRKSKSKVMSRRRTNDKRSLPNLSACPECGALRMSHRICPHCGMYKGRTLLKKD